MKPTIKTLLALAIAFTMIFALAACQKKATYKDGTYHKESAEAGDSGWKDTVDVTISGGKITAVNWDSVWTKDDTITAGKKQYSIEGGYGMKDGGAQSEWHEQAKLVEDFVVANNGTEKLSLITSGDKVGTTDAVSGATIHVSEFKKLVDEALAEAKQ